MTIQQFLTITYQTLLTYNSLNIYYLIESPKCSCYYLVEDVSIPLATVK